MPSYAEFRVRIERGATSRSYRVVASGPGAEATGRMLLPFTEQDLEVFVLRLGRTRRGVRRVNSPEMEQAKAFGTQLFDAVFDGDVRELYRAALSEASEAGQGLRVTLALTGAPELLQVPWEYLYDRPNFLSISTWTPIVRYLDLPKPPRPLQIAFPLRILGMVSAPSDAEPIDVAAEKAKLQTALAALVESGVVAIDWLENASLLGLARQLRGTDYHVFHYIGHGGFDAQAKDGVLLFEDEHGRSVQIAGAQLGDILHDEKSLRLAVLNACEGARTSIEDPFAGVATSLIEREIPAVIGMQFEITDKAAIVFASEFYSTLADGQPVDAAMSEARKSIYAMGNDIEWGTPVLFMRVQDGRLFDVQPHAPVPRPDPLAVAAAATGPATPAETVRGATSGSATGGPPVVGPVEVPDAAEAGEAEANERDRLVAEAARGREAEAQAERDRQAAAETETLRQRLAALEAAQAEEARREAALAAARPPVAPAQAPIDAWSQPVASPPQAPPSGWTQPAAQPATQPAAKKRGGSRIKLLLGLFIAVVIAIAAIDGADGLLGGAVLSTDAPFVTAQPRDPFAGQIAVVPDVRNQTDSEAFQELQSVGFTDVQRFLANLPCEGSVPAGLVIEVLDRATQLPITGFRVPLDNPITVVVSNPIC